MRMAGRKRARPRAAFAFAALLALLAQPATAAAAAPRPLLWRYGRAALRDSLPQRPSLPMAVAVRALSGAVRRSPRPGALAAAAAMVAAATARPPGAHAAGPAGLDEDWGRGRELARALLFWRRVGPVVVHYKLTNLWLGATGAGPARRGLAWESLHERHAPTSLKAILELRGLFVKIGQVMSARADFIPRQYVDRFSTLQDAVPPWPMETIEGLVRGSLRDNQGMELEDVFESFGEVLGSASIGQVHRARLTPRCAAAGGYRGGRDVAVKVMHPDAERRFSSDFKVFRSLCRVALPGWDPIMEELQRQMMTEFDYLNEAANLATVRDNVARSPYSRRVRVPEPAPALCSTNLLVMEMLQGRKLAASIEERLTAILGGRKDLARNVLRANQRALFTNDDEGAEGGGGEEQKSLFRELRDVVEQEGGVSQLGKAAKALQLASLAKDARRKLALLLDVSGHQILIDGVYNGDPHAGNILDLDCGRLGLIDYGQTRRLTEEERLGLARIVAALGTKGSTPAEIAQAMRGFGFQSRDGNDAVIASTAALYFDSDDESRELGLFSPQELLQHLSSIDPMVVVPEAAVFVARASFLFRGMGALLQQRLHTAHSWRVHAERALRDADSSTTPYSLGLKAAR